MKTANHVFVLSSVLLFPIERATAQGIMIENAVDNTLLTIDASHVNISIEDQVAIVTSTQRFVNNGTDTVYPKYAYPLPEAASATRLRWMLDAFWEVASMAAAPQETTLPGVGGPGGDETAPELVSYLGGTPLYFRILNGVPPGDDITIELTYVELLPYANARVELLSASDYSEVYPSTIPEVIIDVSVRSQRAITGIDIAGTGSWSPSATVPYLVGDSAALHVEQLNVQPGCGFAIGYDLDPLAYGLISLSNYLPDSLIKCDELGNGFFVLLIEPEPTSGIIAKDFVIVIDRSGSMSGTKIAEARDAASYMVSNLNAGDHFNVIAFSSSNTRWSTGLQPYTPANMTSALAWIGQITAGGGTNINGALTEGIQDYTGSDPTHAKPLIFLTDGQDSYATTPAILSNVLQLRQSIVPTMQLFSFGIGSGYNEQLLNQLAVQNNGVSQFLETANFSQVMGDFYTQIQNPVLLAPVATFDHPDVMNIHPIPLMGLFIGQQMVIVGRYDVPGPVNLHLDGYASGQPVSFDYAFDLTADYDEGRSFIPKVWAQQAIDALVNEYYTYPTGSGLSEMIEDSVVNYSMCYGIGSPFTSFVDPGNGGGGGGSVGVEEEGDDTPASHIAYPDPAPAGTPLNFDLSGFTPGRSLVLRIFDAMGRVVLEKDLSGHAGSLWIWDGIDAAGRMITGQLVYQLSDGAMTVQGRCTRL